MSIVTESPPRAGDNDVAAVDGPADALASEPRMSVEAVTRWEDLEQHIPAWEELSAWAVEPNPFFEPWMLLPALRSLGEGNDLLVVLVFASKGAEKTLCGVFPLRRQRSFRKFPIKMVEIWKHDYAFLGTPLVHQAHADMCLNHFFQWLKESPESAPLMAFTESTVGGPFHQALTRILRERMPCTFVQDCWSRPLLKRGSDGEAYIRKAISSKHLSKLRQKERQLRKLGTVEYVTLPRDGDWRQAVEQFLALEAKGWKGRAGSAMLDRKGAAEYCRETAGQAFARGRLMMLSLQLNGKPIAGKMNVLANRGGFALKIAFDEDYAKYSPGQLLELENIRCTHKMSDVDWMDSCAGLSSHGFYRWMDQMMLQTLVVGTGKAPGDFFVSLLPLIRWGWRMSRGGKR